MHPRRHSLFPASKHPAIGLWVSLSLLLSFHLHFLNSAYGELNLEPQQQQQLQDGEQAANLLTGLAGLMAPMAALTQKEDQEDSEKNFGFNANGFNDAPVTSITRADGQSKQDSRLLSHWELATLQEDDSRFQLTRPNLSPRMISTERAVTAETSVSESPLAAAPAKPSNENSGQVSRAALGIRLNGIRFARPAKEAKEKEEKAEEPQVNPSKPTASQLLLAAIRNPDGSPSALSLQPREEEVPFNLVAATRTGVQWLSSTSQLRLPPLLAAQMAQNHRRLVSTRAYRNIRQSNERKASSDLSRFARAITERNQSGGRFSEFLSDERRSYRGVASTKTGNTTASSDSKAYRAPSFDGELERHRTPVQSNTIELGKTSR